MRNIAEDVRKRKKGLWIILGFYRCRMKPVGTGIVESDRLAAVGGSRKVSAPERRYQREADDILATPQPVCRRRQDEFRLPVGTILRQTRDRVGDFRIETAATRPS